MAEKNYRSFTGLTEFYYKVHGEGGVQKLLIQNALNIYKKFQYQKTKTSRKHMVITKWQKWQLLTEQLK